MFVSDDVLYQTFLGLLIIVVFRLRAEGIVASHILQYQYVSMLHLKLVICSCSFCMYTHEYECSVHLSVCCTSLDFLMFHRDVVTFFSWVCYSYELLNLFQRDKQVSRRLICSVATETVPEQVEESKMGAPKEIFLKDYKMPDYYFDTVW